MQTVRLLFMASSMHIDFIRICGTDMGSAEIALRALGHTISGSVNSRYGKLTFTIPSLPPVPNFV
ncbi:MAG: hypothetical protein B7Z37_00620 [Verrucomicrobia bacterium 12-59-8]|nr:MAG: hypothetical protein B7Z37_00620 [Verrucomicrobia bacterium 12-59-8]